ncbi:DUF6-domain-containing protein [Lophiostoma macrostomum CBS 122681]|uniref:DUF6-domain-containing protein n=1 Tax=Lophiostoma macrostomum CBS 122681 TaxID=1314788 RepID=A0A6A6SPY0_9PLEO|nr:DUF6-domain-containing protein [Lophiostoma macrostomum CBS 122681]
MSRSHTVQREGESSSLLCSPDTDRYAEASRFRDGRWRRDLTDFYNRNFGLLLVFIAQTCSSVMNVAAKLLTTGYEENFHPMQIIFIRMSCTTLLGAIYMLYQKTPDFPLGKPGIRWLLVLRGTAGFVGLFGLYYSLTWLQFSDATVITFIIPTMTALVCFVWLREPYTWKEALAGVIAFAGVLFVARPPWLFPVEEQDPITNELGLTAEKMASVLSSVVGETADKPPMTPAPLSPVHKAAVISIGVVGAFMGATAYATIRVIGKRAHSLISVNYFAAIATVGSALILTVHPDLHFVMPQRWSQWGLMTIIGLAGFMLQFLLTEGLQREKAGRATNLTYLQLVFALIVERVIWGTTPPFESLLGAILIVGAAIWVSMQKNEPGPQPTTPADEESSLLPSNGHGNDRS